MKEIKLAIWFFDRLCCRFGFHRPSVYKGKIIITHVDRNAHKIEYGNVLQCPICGKDIKTTFI